MEEIIINKKTYDSLRPISFEHERVFKIYINEGKILKKFPYNEELANDLIYTVKSLNELKNLFSKEFLIPESLVKYNNQIIGFTVKEILDSTTLDVLLKSKIPHKMKISYLKKIGGLLRICDEVRKQTDFVLTDLHQENILIEPKNSNIYFIDLDSSKIKDNLVKPARYLSTECLANNINKYEKNKNNFIIPTRETEIYNYIIIILNYILNLDVAYMKIEEYKNILDYLESLQFNKELIQIFYKIVNPNNNENPDYLLDTITEEQVKSIEINKSYKKF